MEIPDAIVRREILYSVPKRKPNFQTLGDAYLEVGRLTDAFESYLKLEDEAARSKSLDRVKAQGISDGNAFVLGLQHINHPLTDDEWRQAGEKARAQGKTRYALKIAQRLEDADLIVELERELGIDQPPVPDDAEGDAEGSEDAESA